MFKEENVQYCKGEGQKCICFKSFKHLRFKYFPGVTVRFRGDNPKQTFPLITESLLSKVSAQHILKLFSSKARDLL